MLGEDGGYGRQYFLTWLVASVWNPAKTVRISSGFFVLSIASLAAGLAFLAAHPQTELITTSCVPSVTLRC